MHSFKVASLVAFMAVAVSAQSSGGNLSIDASLIDPQNRIRYCGSQKNSCIFLCPGGYDSNSCDTTTLTFNCTCSPPQDTPDLSEFTETIPYFQCQEYIDKCVRDTDVAREQKECLDTKCGSEDPSKYKGSSSGSSSDDDSDDADATATEKETATGTSTSTATATGNDAGKVGAKAGMMLAFVGGLIAVVA